jgi:fibronectin-binding autotransporter adhesin
MQSYVTKIKCLTLILFLFFSFSTSKISQGANHVAVANGNWGDGTTWDVGTVPVAGELVQIGQTYTVTVNVNNAVCGQCQLGTGGGSSGPGTLVFNAGSQLTVAGNANGVKLGAAGGNTGTLDMTAGGTLITCAITNSNGAFTPGAGTVVYSTTAANLSMNTFLTTYNNLTIDDVGFICTLGVNTTCNGNFTITAGTFAASTFTLNVKGNFSNSATFTQNTSTVNLNATAASQTISGSTATTFYNLTFNNTSAAIPQITLGIGATVTNTLTMTSGVVNLAGFTFTLGSSGVASTLSRTASTTTNWVYGGTFKRFWLISTAITSTSGNYYGLFPVGTSNSSSYRPVEINTLSSPTAGGFFTVNHIDAGGTLDLNPTYNDAGFNITRIHNAQFVTTISGVTGGLYNMGVTMTGLSAGTLSDIRLAIYTGGTTASVVGIHNSATGSASNPTAQRMSIGTVTDFNNDFRIATTNSGSTPLPIELLKFTATAHNDEVDLSWTTATETNNNFFTIEKSNDGKTFECINTVKGAGNSTARLDYFSVDTNPYFGISYYRLKQTDFNGKYSYSKLVAVELIGKNNFDFNVYPNPNNGESINLSFREKKGEKILVVVYDAYGKKIYSKIIVVESDGNNVYAIDEFKKLAPGIYMVTATSHQIIDSKKLIVK